MESTVRGNAGQSYISHTPTRSTVFFFFTFSVLFYLSRTQVVSTSTQILGGVVKVSAWMAAKTRGILLYNKIFNTRVNPGKQHDEKQSTYMRL